MEFLYSFFAVAQPLPHQVPSTGAPWFFIVKSTQTTPQEWIVLSRPKFRCRVVCGYPTRATDHGTHRGPFVYCSPPVKGSRRRLHANVAFPFNADQKLLFFLVRTPFLFPFPLCAGMASLVANSFACNTACMCRAGPSRQFANLCGVFFRRGGVGLPRRGQVSRCADHAGERTNLPFRNNALRAQAKTVGKNRLGYRTRDIPNA